MLAKLKFIKHSSCLQTALDTQCQRHGWRQEGCPFELKLCHCL